MREDRGDARANRAAPVGVRVAHHGRVADPHTHDVGDRVERAGRIGPDHDAEIARPSPFHHVLPTPCGDGRRCYAAEPPFDRLRRIPDLMAILEPE